MSETQKPASGDALIDARDPFSFSIESKIKGLPYQLSGQVPQDPDNFELVVGLPQHVWNDIQPVVERELANNSWFAKQYQHTQQALRLGDGRVGSVWVSHGSSPDGAPTVHVDRIQTELGYLPEESEYHNAKGVGSAILDNLCALADSRGWRITLDPLERDSRLAGNDLQEWYRRRGFKFGFEVDEQQAQTMYPQDDMLRLPGVPDYDQPILQALTAEQHL